MAARGLRVLGNYSVSYATSPAHHITQYLLSRYYLTSQVPAPRYVISGWSPQRALLWRSRERIEMGQVQGPQRAAQHMKERCVQRCYWREGTGNTVGKVARLKAEGVGKRRPSLIGTRSSCPPELLAKERGGPMAPCASFVGNDPFT